MVTDRGAVSSNSPCRPGCPRRASTRSDRRQPATFSARSDCVTMRAFRRAEFIRPATHHCSAACELVAGNRDSVVDPCSLLHVQRADLGRTSDQARVFLGNHLAAALIGVALAIMLRYLDIPSRARYSWKKRRSGRIRGRAPQLKRYLRVKLTSIAAFAVLAIFYASTPCSYSAKAPAATRRDVHRVWQAR
jgi:hypothetical protein